MPAVMSGEVSMTFGTAVVVPLIKSGKLMALGVTGPKRSPLLPDVPTIAEAGVPGYEVTSWNGMYAPAATPAPVVKLISARVQEALRDPDIIGVFDRQGIDPAPSSPAELAQMGRAEFVKWATVIKSSKIVLD
jgi:tripartite-type tricarboxylate transporter receptor subunit TctC